MRGPVYNRAMPERVVRRILVPVELTDRAPVDADYAIGLAAQLGAELMLLTVIDTAAMVHLIGHHRMVGGGGRADFQVGVVEDAKAYLQDIVDRAARKGVRALGHATVSEEIVEQILKEALVQRVDLILVRSAGKSGLMQALLGGTAGDILKAAPCPVLVARP
jgi:nucleotide-binding universal stress UspA family protein